MAEEALIKITETNGKQAVSARELYNFLEVQTPFTMWAERMFEYGFTESIDYVSLSQKSDKPKGGRPQMDYVLTLDCAKEISMLQRSEKGKQARLYFIECEKKLREVMVLPTTFAEALQLAANQAKELEAQQKLIENQKKQLDESKDWYTIKRRAMIKGINWKLYNWREMKRLSVLADKPIKKVFDANYGEVNLYHISIFETYEKTLKR